MLPLEGITVIDLTSVVAGPLATQIMAQQGARVWKIEPPEGDRARLLGAIAAPGFSSAHVALNAGKQSIALDLARAEGRALLCRLVPHADLLIHNFRPGVMERLGLGTAALHALRPDLVIARISGFGQDGPMCGTRAYDPIIQAESGMVSWDDSGEPTLAPQWICDKTAGLYAAQAATAALVARGRSGEGTVVDISMLEAAVAYGWIDLHGAEVFPDAPSRMPNIAAVYRPWATADGWIVVVMLSQSEFEGWARAIGALELLSDPRYADMVTRFLHWDDLRAFSAPRVAAMTTSEAVERLAEAGVPCGVANRSAVLPDHAQLAHDDFVALTDHPQAGPVRRARAVARFDGARAGTDAHAPRVGEHGRAILAAAGLDAAEIAAALAMGAVHLPEEI
ncbi:CaiB/BaiF CoA transferase family protein [Sphingopyxis granuli]|uniref:Acyl-CoA transferase/carnitine dehydratase n=1 Tax=Sphingopyxis granuli TaxID=267128 RepID=A0AA86GJN4_9SPHN|nr:CoA transferase [Sphingopyxis granuli]AMG73813.1 Acyl-CoA transferase/carnitine dehydratase [Sphingopyxis granuli]